MIYYFCSDGKRISEAGIKARYGCALKEKHAGQTVFMCECCQRERAVDNSHIIAKARCKVLHKTELIWNPKNFVNACRTCHDHWEGWKSGEYLDFVNIKEMMRFLREHDPEVYLARIHYDYA